MRKTILILNVLMLAGVLALVAGCGSGPAAPEIRDLDFSGFESFIRTTDLPDDMMVTVRYQEIDGALVVTGIDTGTAGGSGIVHLPMEKVETDSTGTKDGDDDTEIQVTWGELKALYR